MYKAKRLSAAKRALLAKMLGMLGSKHSGERDNAALAAEKLRRESGLNWSEIIGAGGKATASNRTPKRARSGSVIGSGMIKGRRGRPGKWKGVVGRQLLDEVDAVVKRRGRTVNAALASIHRGVREHAPDHPYAQMTLRVLTSRYYDAVRYFGK
jgi:hypothetical protein